MEKNNQVRLKPCPRCGDVWLYVSDGDWFSAYESRGYRVNCKCSFAWNAIPWCNTKDKATIEWNKVADRTESL